MYWITQENLIESSLQNNLSYILLQMVCARYCVFYPKWLCVKHEANIWCPYCMTLFCSRTFYSLLLSSVINVVTTPSDVTDVTVWPITSNPNPRVLKIEKSKINQKENKRKLSLLSAILIVFFYWSVINYNSCSSCAKWVWMIKVFKPWTTLGYWWYNNLHIIIVKFKEFYWNLKKIYKKY